jgi:Flp pilus assembly protein TadD
MRPTIKCLSAICASTLLFACADPGNRAPAASGTGMRAADAAYVDARRHHLAGRLEQAEAAYRGALAADPAHVNARNGLATLYAEKGDFRRAIPIWQALTEKRSLGSGPGSAFLFNNLGYAYLLEGEYDKAVAALEKACLLDPLNHRAWLHLGHALYKTGQEERARQMFSQANALQQHDLRRDYTVAGGNPAPAIEAAVTVAPRREEEWAAHDVVVGMAGILELRRVTAAPAPAAAQATEAARPPAVPALPGPAPAPQDAPALALLEIRNGNGVTGMARNLSHQMGDPALKVVRLSNEKGFSVRQTRVEYRVPFRDAAERLAQRFGGAQAVQVESIRAADMRLVIGRDLVKARFTLRAPAAPEPRLADAG